MKRIYIAGPISNGDLATNIRNATAAFVELVGMGLFPLCPHWSCFSGTIYLNRSNVAVEPDRKFAYATTEGCGIPYDRWIAIGVAWAASADAVLRLPGESSGADRECEAAARSGKPVFDSIAELQSWAQVIGETPSSESEMPSGGRIWLRTDDFLPQDRPIQASKLARILFDAFDNLQRSEPDKLNAYDICEAFRDIARSIAHPLREGEHW